MIQTSQVHHCRECGSAPIVKNGHNRCGSQQYLCRECGASRVLAHAPQTPMVRGPRVSGCCQIFSSQLTSGSRLKMTRWDSSAPN